MTTIDAGLLSLLVIVEYIADFKLQSRYMATKKSEDIVVLIKHVGIIFAALFTSSLAIFTYLPGTTSEVPIAALGFAGTNVLIHGIIDWNIWGFYKRGVLSKLGLQGMDLEHPPIQKQIKDFKYWEDKMFYDTIGLDRLLHIITLIITYQIFWG